jgi:uncharacterized protein
MTMLETFLLTALTYLREFAEVALLGFFLAGIINAAVNKDVVARHLGRHVLGANALATVWGFLVPLCCCSGIPTALTLYRAGSRRGPACAFLIAVPWFNWYGLTALVIFLGWRAGLAVSLSAVVVGFVAGVAIDAVGDRPAARRTASPLGPHDAPEDPDCWSSSCPAPAAPGHLLDLTRPREKVRAGVGFALDLLRELGPWMLAGILLGAAAEALIPKDLVTRFLGGPRVAGLLAALVIAGVFYTDSLGSLPWVRTLLDKGLGAGSGMVLLVAGVGTNLSTLGPVARIMGVRTAIVYAASVVVLTAVLGYLLNRML